jgi:hypothetical protein
VVGAVAGSKKKKTKTGSGWSWRLAGLALCAFFALGVVTGLSESGRVLARRIQTLLHRLPLTSRSELIPSLSHGFFKVPAVENLRWPSGPPTPRAPAEAIALVEHRDGLYQIGADGRLFGPVSPADTADVPVLSGSEVEHAENSQLLEYAGELIRAETTLSVIISEMRVISGGEIHIYLNRPHLMIVFTQSQFPFQLVRAARVLEIWHRHREFIGVIDLTVPREAIVSLRAQRPERSGPPSVIGGVRPASLNSFLHGHEMTSEDMVSN